MNVVTLTLGPFGTNCYLVWPEAGSDALVVDCAGDSGAILAEAQRRELQIRVIVITHGHIDHIDDLAALVSATSARLAVHALDAGSLTDSMTSGAALFGFPQHPVTPDLLLREGDAVAREETGLPLTVLHTPGHTPGSICLLGEGKLFTGDTLFAGGIGRTDLPGGSQREILSSLQRLMELPGDLVVYPGHGPATTLAEERQSNPWLQGW